MTALYESVAEFRSSLDALNAIEDLDAATYADTLEGMAGALEAKLRAVIAYSLEKREDAAARHKAAARMKQLGDRDEAQADWLQRYALAAMQATGIGSVETDEFAAKVAKTPGKIVIADDADLPTEYLRVKTVSEPDKAALKDALQAGREIAGVSLVSGFRLALR